MPKADRARAAHAVLAATRRCVAADRAYLALAIRKVLSVFSAVAMHAKRLAIADVKSQVGMRGPSCDMVCMEFASCTTANASEAVAVKNSCPPLANKRRQGSPLFIARGTVFPRGGILADHVTRLALLRAIDLPFIGRVKCGIAPAAVAIIRGATHGPTLLAAKLRRARAVLVGPVACTTDGTNQRNALASTQYGLSWFGWHDGIITEVTQHRNISPQYVDVIIRRFLAKHPDQPVTRHDGKTWQQLDTVGTP